MDVKELKESLKVAKLIRKQANSDVKDIENQLNQILCSKLDVAVKDGILEKGIRWNMPEYHNKYLIIYPRGGNLRVVFNHDNFDYKKIKEMGWEKIGYCTFRTFINRAKKSDIMLYTLGSKIQEYLK
jgi:hypothetical protein